MARKGKNHPSEPPPPPPPPPAASSSSSSSSSEEDSDDELPKQEAHLQSSSEEEEEEPKKIKPIASKPMMQEEPSSNLKKPRSKPTTTVAALPAVKPPPAKDSGDTPAKKRKREKAEAIPASGEGEVQDEGKKKQLLLFQRLWSEDDEIVILKGMIDYKAKKGSDPLSNPDDFLQFVKKSLHVVDVNKGQIVNKVRRLKKKYENNSKKKKRITTNPHELKAFELSKKIWGTENDGKIDNGVADNNDKNNNKDLSLKGSNIKNKGSKVSKGVDEQILEEKKEEEEKEEDGKWTISRCNKEICVVDEGSLGFLDFGFLKEGLKLLSEGQRVELEEEWRKINVAEMEICLKRLDFYRAVMQETLNGLKSAEN